MFPTSISSKLLTKLFALELELIDKDWTYTVARVLAIAVMSNDRPALAAGLKSYAETRTSERAKNERLQTAFIMLEAFAAQMAENDQQ